MCSLTAPHYTLLQDCATIADCTGDCVECKCQNVTFQPSLVAQTVDEEGKRGTCKIETKCSSDDNEESNKDQQKRYLSIQDQVSSLDYFCNASFSSEAPPRRCKQYYRLFFSALKFHKLLVNNEDPDEREILREEMRRR